MYSHGWTSLYLSGVPSYSNSSRHLRLFRCLAKLSIHSLWIIIESRTRLILDFVCLLISVLVAVDKGWNLNRCFFIDWKFFTCTPGELQSSLIKRCKSYFWDLWAITNGCVTILMGLYTKVTCKVTIINDFGIGFRELWQIWGCSVFGNFGTWKWYFDLTYIL